jgi:hypothetical protein
VVGRWLDLVDWPTLVKDFFIIEKHMGIYGVYRTALEALG